MDSEELSFMAFSVHEIEIPVSVLNEGHVAS